MLLQAVFTLNEPDANGTTPAQAASWYIEYINPLVSNHTHITTYA